MFAIEQEEKWAGSYSLNIVDDIYQTYYANEDHLVFSVSTPDVSSSHR
jgi:hypothetical protein